MSSKFFCTDEHINPQQHYHVDRCHEVNEICGKLSDGKYVLLHAHPQAGKSSMIHPIVAKLSTETSAVIIVVSLRGLDDSHFWKVLSATMSTELGTPPFESVPAFLSSISRRNFGGKDLFLIIDDIDVLLDLPQARVSLFGILKNIKTSNEASSATHERHYMLKGVLGIGVFDVRLLTEESGMVPVSPFNISELYRLQQPTLEAVVNTFLTFGRDHNISEADMEQYALDIFGRTQGHLGLTSLLGKVLTKWIESVDIGAKTFGGWIAHFTFSQSVQDEIAQCSTLLSINNALTEEPARNRFSGSIRLRRPVEAARSLVFNLLHAGETVPLPFDALEREAVDYLETEGIIVRENDGTEIRLSAALLRTRLYSTFATPRYSTVPAGVTLPMKPPAVSSVETFPQASKKVSELAPDHFPPPPPPALLRQGGVVVEDHVGAIVVENAAAITYSEDQSSDDVISLRNCSIAGTSPKRASDGASDQSPSKLKKGVSGSSARAVVGGGLEDLTGALALLRSSNSAKSEADRENLMKFLEDSGVESEEDLFAYAKETVAFSERLLKPAKFKVLLHKLGLCE